VVKLPAPGAGFSGPVLNPNESEMLISNCRHTAGRGRPKI